ncbi:MAG: histidine triad nucleotide-binding protein [Porticoccaceae bacterium]|jgi:histidine triad (HIT) family protein|nr:histidine triad nucleotide-binding protein [Porticoccaceae bacterium]MBT7374757.1 histidine triad nucleotide-binding protein [Porticoccaceae bacterium]MDG1485532.1 histidine triad nucleotide-binding protein [Porticoccaceae bacterium]
MTTASLFSRIINREIPADIVYEDDQCIVINDIAPQAPVHMLVIPRQPIPCLADASQADKALLGHLMWVAGEVARQNDIDEAFRLVVNNGADAGQTIFHLHLHVLANKGSEQTFSEANL